MTLEQLKSTCSYKAVELTIDDTPVEYVDEALLSLLDLKAAETHGDAGLMKISYKNQLGMMSGHMVLVLLLLASLADKLERIESQRVAIPVDMKVREC